MAASCHPHGNLAASASPWSAGHRVMFRFVFAFLVLVIFPFPFNSFGGSIYPTGVYEKMWFAVASWVATHILHLTPTPAGLAALFLADDTNGYVELLSICVGAVLATILWTLLDQKRTDYRTLHEWLRIYVRYALGFTMLGYGMDKVFALQFNSSLPGPGRLAEPLGNYSPFALMWTFMGYSKAYTIFAGVGEVIGGLLLVFRKTTTLGALITCFVMANVLALDASYGVGLRVLVSLFILFAIFLLASDMRRLVNVFVLNRATLPVNLEGPIPNYWMKGPRRFLHAAVVVLALYFFAGPGLAGPRERGKSPKSPLYGLYQVEAFLQDGKPIVQNDANWRRVIFEGETDMTVLSMDDSMLYYGADVDTAKNIITISGKYADPETRSQRNVNDTNPHSILTYSWRDSDHLEFRGKLADDAVVITMRKVDISKFTLVSRGFHWVDTPPFYR